MTLNNKQHEIGLFIHLEIEKLYGKKLVPTDLKYLRVTKISVDKKFNETLTKT